MVVELVVEANLVGPPRSQWVVVLLELVSVLVVEVVGCMPMVLPAIVLVPVLLMVVQVEIVG